MTDGNLLSVLLNDDRASGESLEATHLLSFTDADTHELCMQNPPRHGDDSQPLPGGGRKQRDRIFGGRLFRMLVEVSSVAKRASFVPHKGAQSLERKVVRVVFSLRKGGDSQERNVNTEWILKLEKSGSVQIW